MHDFCYSSLFKSPDLNFVIISVMSYFDILLFFFFLHIFYLWSWWRSYNFDAIIYKVLPISGFHNLLFHPIILMFCHFQFVNFDFVIMTWHLIFDLWSLWLFVIFPKPSCNLEFLFLHNFDFVKVYLLQYLIIYDLNYDLVSLFFFFHNDFFRVIKIKLFWLLCRFQLNFNKFN